MESQKDLQWLVLEKLGKEAAEGVDWSAPRAHLHIRRTSPDTDDHAVKQIQRNVELIRYRRFGTDLLMLDLALSATTASVGSADNEGTVVRYRTISTVLAGLDAGMADRFEALRSFLLALGDDVQQTVLQYYIAFKRIRNFACIEFRPADAREYNLRQSELAEVTLEEGFTRDVSDIGHYGTGDSESRCPSLKTWSAPSHSCKEATRHLRRRTISQRLDFLAWTPLPIQLEHRRSRAC